MARRGINIYLRKDGRYEGRYIKGHKTDGGPIYGSVYARKYQECKEKLVQAKVLHVNRDRAVKTCGTGSVSEYIMYWLYGIVRQYIKQSTFSSYAAIVDKWIKPMAGSLKLCKVGKEDVQRFVNVLMDGELSAGTVRNIYRVLYSAMKTAQAHGYVHVNPCEGVSLPESERKEARLLSVEEQKRLERTAKTDRNGFPVLLSMYTGLRVGEICALKWSDVDLERGVIRVSRTIQRIRAVSPDALTKTVLITGSAKSRNSSRTIPLPVCIKKMFEERKNMSSSEYVFTCKKHPLEPRILQYRFKALLRKAGLGDINFHALRHTFATRCMELCFDVKTLSEILGHASAKMTLDRYGHSQIEHKRAAMQNLDRLFARTA